MIILIKGRDYKRLLVKGVAFFLIFLMFYFYYQHMASKFQEQNNSLQAKVQTQDNKKKEDKSQKLEDIVYEESVKVVNLLNQRNIDSIKVENETLIISCDIDTDIEPLLIRYGVQAMVKSTMENIIINIRIKTILEGNYEK